MLEKLQNLRPREKLMLFLACLALLAVALDWGVVTPLTKYVKRIRSEIRVAEQNVRSAESVAALEAEAKTVSDACRDALETSASPAEAIDDMKGQVDDLAKRSQLNVLTLDHREPEPLGSLETYRVEIGQFESDLNALLQFLHEIRMASGLMRVEKVVLNPDKDTGLFKGSILVSKVMIRGAAPAAAPAESEAAAE